jgi:hypothetical protein
MVEVIYASKKSESLLWRDRLRAIGWRPRELFWNGREKLGNTIFSGVFSSFDIMLNAERRELSESGDHR